MARLAERIVAHLHIFRDADREGVAALAREARTRYVARGETLAHAGQTLPGLMGVGYGVVKLAVPGREQKVVSLVVAHETFGEAALLLGRPLPLDAVAVAECLLVIVPAGPFLALVARDPRLARSLLRALGSRLHGLAADLGAATLCGASQRLAAYLDSLAAPGSAPCTVRLPVTKTVIAGRLGMTKETLSRLLREFSDSGLVSIAGREIVLLDRAGLALKSEPAL